MSGLWLPDSSKLAVNCKNSNDVTIFQHDGIANFFDVFLFLLSSLDYWPKFHVNIITGFGDMTISFYKGLTRNPEIGNTLVWVLSISRDWSKQGIPNLARTSLIKCYSMLQNVRVIAFAVSELLRENQLAGKLTPSPPPRSMLKNISNGCKKWWTVKLWSFAIVVAYLFFAFILY